MLLRERLLQGPPPEPACALPARGAHPIDVVQARTVPELYTGPNSFFVGLVAEPVRVLPAVPRSIVLLGSGAPEAGGRALCPKHGSGRASPRVGRLSLGECAALPYKRSRL